MQKVALLGGMAFFCVSILGAINRYLVERFYLGELVSQLYTKQELSAHVTQEPSSTTLELPSPSGSPRSGSSFLYFSGSDLLPCASSRCCKSRGTVLFAQGAGLLANDLDIVQILRKLKDSNVTRLSH